MEKKLIRIAEEILRCPKTGKNLVFNELKENFTVQGMDREYSIIDGIIISETN